ncbi:MAG: diguanylate cyclase [Acidimicrobiales bacterium]|nr:diguanylate cyclase [Acidimicrobiales bacterium]
MIEPLTGSWPVPTMAMGAGATCVRRWREQYGEFMADEPTKWSELRTQARPTTAFTVTRHISRVAAIFDAAPIGVGVWSMDGELLHANPVLCDLLAGARSELVGRLFEEFIRLDEAAGIRNLVRDLWLGTRNYFECDFRCTRPSGREHWVRTYVSPVYGPGGEPEYLVSHIFSFGRRGSEEDMTSRLTNDTPVMLWVTDEHGIPRSGNKKSFEFLGLPPSSSELRRALFERIHPEDYESARAGLIEHIRRREAFEFTARSRRADGEWRWLHHRAEPIRGEDGSFEGYAGASFDVTDAEQMRRELDEIRRLFQSVTDAGPIAVLRTDAAGNVTYANGRWADILDDPEARLRETSWRSILVPEHVEEIIRRSLESIESGEPFVMRVRAVDPMKLAPNSSGLGSGQYWGELRVAPVFDEDGNHDGFVATLTDVSSEVAADTRADRLARVLDAGSDFLLIAERNGAISYVNDAALETLGVRPADSLAGRETPYFLMDVLDADSFEFFHEVVEPVLVEAGIWRGELTLRDRSGSLIPVSALILAQPNEAGRVDSISIVARDITDLKDAERRMRELATHDYLTGLPNRVLLYDRLEQALARFHRHQRPVALMYLDLDRFKPVNDEFGHHVGDAVLCQISDRIHAIIRETDTAARIGGDEFAVLVEGVEDLGSLELVASRLIEAISAPIQVDELIASVGVSIGVVIANEHCAEADALMALADSAMYEAKAKGRGRYELVIPNGGLRHPSGGAFRE